MTNQVINCSVKHITQSGTINPWKLKGIELQNRLKVTEFALFKLSMYSGEENVTKQGHEIICLKKNSINPLLKGITF